MNIICPKNYGIIMVICLNIHGNTLALQRISCSNPFPDGNQYLGLGKKDVVLLLLQ